MTTPAPFSPAARQSFRQGPPRPVPAGGPRPAQTPQHIPPLVPPQIPGAPVAGFPQQRPQHHVSGGPLPHPPRSAPVGPYPPAGAAPWPLSASTDERPRLNTPALLSAVLLVVCAPASIVLGLIGRRQAERRGERGRALATVGVVVGAALTLICTAAVVLVLASGAVQVRTAVAPQEPAARVAAGIVETSQGRAQDMTCPQDLPGTVGATIACTGTIDGRPAAVRVTTTEVQGQDVGYHWEQVS